ncbi:MAG TPA: tetratricopeptide repeat protein [Verrucomicrobiae bacterium]|nr:tetratricopeptide repeat protein [Verrucomicrobiae bacterium]
MSRLAPILLIPAFLLGSPATSWTQSKLPGPAATEAQKALDHAAIGHCAEAIPELRSVVGRLTDADLKKRVGLAGLRCAMIRNRPYEAVGFLQILSHDFPRDPEVLYQETKAYSDLSIRASQDLVREAPFSYQVHELNAEALEVQGKWDEAAAEYKKILDIDPNLPGIHYRLGRVLLSKPNPPQEVLDEAKRNFEQELKIDPQNAGAEGVLGELARQANQCPDAIDHFTRATELDNGFAEAYLGLGSCLLVEKRYADAVAPLETAVKLEPGNPAAHYNLATALSRVGRKDEAEREFAIHRKMQEANTPPPPAPNP